jgi:hypothetical protein
VKTHYDITLRGGICGAIWWPYGAKCGMNLSVNLSREIARIHSPDGSRVTLRNAIKLVLCEKGGDFQSARLTGDTEICVTAYRTSESQRITSERTRYWLVTAFPSIAYYVDTDTHSSDFNSEE